jgi:orotate phosphoribosyltransferase
MVAYAGTYNDEATGEELRLVGPEYYDCSKVETHPRVLRYFARRLTGLVQLQTGLFAPDAVLGMPIGGMTLSYALSEELGCRYIFAEKDGPRGDQKLVMGRHGIQPGWKVVVGEELVNNAKSSSKVLRLIEEAGAECIGVAGMVNRNQDGITVIPESDIPIIMVIEVPTPQYRQDDPRVLGTIERGYPIVLEGKKQYAILQAAMNAGTGAPGEQSIDEGRCYGPHDSLPG